MKKPVSIPCSPLSQKLEAAVQLKVEATELLRELETKATGHTIDRPGRWRQDPAGWLKRHR